MKGYKAFNKGLVCKGKQYAENTVFEEEKAEICEHGMHYCKNPFDVLDYYPLVNENGDFSDFAEVEALETPVTDDNKKFATKKLRIGAKLGFSGFIKASVRFLLEKNIKEAPDVNVDTCGPAQIGSSGYSAQIGSSGYYAQIGSAGDCARIGSTGDYAKIGSTGDYAKIGSTGDYAKIGSSGYSARIGSSGGFAQIGSTGDYARIGSSGGFARIGSTGDYAQIGSSGDSAQIGSSGYSAQIGSSGYSARIGSTGEDAVICCAGHGSVVKAKKGSWITLSEWEYNGEKKRYTPVCVKTEYVDGERIKEDVFYMLHGGEFVESEVRNDKY